MDARLPLDQAWPLFALRIRTERLVLRLPDDHDLAALAGVARAGIHGPDEMPFKTPWSTFPSPQFERNFVQHHWGGRGSWTADDWGLHLLVELDGEPIGSQSVLAKKYAALRTVRTGSWLGRPFHGLGYGKEMRAGVLGFAFDGLGARIAETEAYLDNGPSNGVSRSLGYEPNGISEFAPGGVPRTVQHFRMTADMWRARPRPAVRSRASTAVSACSAPSRRRPGRARGARDRAAASGLETAPGRPPPAPPPPPPEPPPEKPPPPPELPDDAGEFPIVPSAPIIPPMSGMPEPEKMLPPLPVAPAAFAKPAPLLDWYQAGNQTADALVPSCLTSSRLRWRTSSMRLCRPRAVPQTTAWSGRVEPGRARPRRRPAASSAPGPWSSRASAGRPRASPGSWRR